MNDQSQMMNQHQILSQLNQPQLVNQPPQQQQQPTITSQPPSQMVSQQQMMNHMNQAQMLNQGQMMGQNYGSWSQPPSNMPPPPMNALNSLKFANPMINMYGAGKPGRNNWKGKKPMDKRKDGRRKDMAMAMAMANSGGGVVVGGVGGMGYKPPTLQELEQQNRLKARRFYHRKKFNRMGPYAHAPRNTTSFIIRAKKAGGIASHISPYPVTPAVLPTPVFSPSREALVEMAKEEWGVDGYGSMKGLIRLRSSPGHETEVDDYEEEDEDGSSESDVEEHLEVERRLDHDLSRFEMIYPDRGADHNIMLDYRADDQDTHIAQLEEENLLLKDRLYIMERELGDLRRRLLLLERRNQVVEVINDEVVENVSENDSERLHTVHFLGQKSDEEVDSVPGEEEGGLNGAKERDGSVETLGNLESGARGEEGTVLNVGEGKQDRAICGEGFMLVEVDSKDGTLENEGTGEIGEMCRKGSVLENTEIEWNGNKDLRSGSTGIEVEAKVDDNGGGALEHEFTGDTVMEESDKVMGDVEADKVNDIKDLGSVNAEVGVEAEVESSGEALKNEPIGDLHMEGSVKVTNV